MFVTLDTSFSELRLLEVSRTIIIWSISATENPLKGLSKLGAEDCVDDGVEGRVEISQPEEKTTQGDIEHFFENQTKKQY